MAESMAVGPKHAAKSKTNIVQLPFIALLASTLAIPEVQHMICNNGQLVLGAQIILTLLARNIRGGLTFRRKAR